METDNQNVNMSTLDASVVVAPEGPKNEGFKKFSLPKLKLPFARIKKVRLIIAAIILVVSLALGVVYFVFRNFMFQAPLEPTPAPVATATPAEKIEEPSPYAGDEEVLAIEEKVQALEAELQKISFREDKLRLPSLDWQVNFAN